MAELVTWVDQFTGKPQKSAIAPLGSAYPAIPSGQVMLGDPFSTLYLIDIPAGGSADTAYATTWLDPKNFISDRGTRGDQPLVFYMPGDEYKILRAQEDIGAFQAALEAIGALSGDYMRGEIDESTAKAMAKVLGAANASGKTWREVLDGGLEAANAAAARRGSGSGSGSGVAAITDEDIKAVGNKVAQTVIGRNLSDEEIGGFIPAFRGAIGGGTSPTTAAENVVRQVNPGEASAHDVGNAMQMVSKMLGGLP